MHFLVTGGAGFIGSHLCERLVEKGHSVVCLDNFNLYYDPRIKRKNVESLLSSGQYRLVQGDILKPQLLEDVFDEGSIDCVVHLAARAGVRPSIQKPRLYQKVNVEGTVNLLECSVRSGVSKFILASSSSVYGNNKKIPFSETDPVDFPISPYAATKKACELIAYTYNALHGIPITCLRFFTVYGPRQRPDMAIHKFTRLIHEGREVPIYGDGTSQRDYTYITDILDGIEKSIASCTGYHIYNLGESRTIELMTLIRLLERELGKEAKIEKLPVQQGDVTITFADISRARKELGYVPCVPVEEGVKAFVAWYRENVHLTK